VMQSARAGGTDVHARPAPDGLEAFEDRDIRSLVPRLPAARCLLYGCFPGGNSFRQRTSE
jgi:hypothetical protein